jgi:hypothetical protein
MASTVCFEENMEKKFCRETAVLLAFFIVICTPLSLFADTAIPTNPICVERHSEDKPTAALAKLLCGVSDIGFCWTEIFWYPSVSDNKVKGVCLGPVRTLARVFTGAGEVLTFFIPGVTVKKLSPECAIAIVDPKKV